MTAGYDTLIVTFSDPICVLDRMFDCPAWGVESLKEWIDGYESTRMTPINDHTAVITSEYNTEYPYMTMTFGRRKHDPLPSAHWNI